MSIDALIVQAREHGAMVVEQSGAIVIVLQRAPARSGDELVPLVRAAVVAATSVRVVREAIRSGELAAFGRQRDRAVRSSDLNAWIESRATSVVSVEDDHAARIERRMKRRAR